MRRLRSPRHPAPRRPPALVSWVFALDWNAFLAMRVSRLPRMARTVTAPSYRADIDGLRAVAVLSVVLYHAFPGAVPGGYVGVDIFFVISGYLITGIILAPLKAGEFSFADFYARRVRRIFPALVVVLAATGAIGWFALSPPALAQLGKHVAASAAFVPNLVFWGESGYFDRGAELKPLLHLWSLGVEEQFYVAWPVALYLLARSGRSLAGVLAAATAASFIACVLLVQSDPAGAFYSPLTRAWELFLGALLRSISLEPLRARESRALLVSGLGAALIAGSVALLSKATTFPGGWALMPTVGAAMIIAAGPGTAINRVLSSRGLVGVGLISYPVYLWHWPLLAFAFIHAHGTPSAAIRVAALVAAVALAAATYVWVEKPIRHGRRARWHVPALIASMALIGIAGLATFRLEGFKGRFPVTLQSVMAYESYDFAKDARANRCWISKDADFSAYLPECHLDPATARERGVLVWGDSHAGRLYPGIRSVLGPGANIAQLTRDSCLPILDRSDAGCREGNERIFEEIVKMKPHTVVLFGYWDPASGWAPGSELDRLLRQTLRRVRAAGVPNVVLVGAAPKWKAALPTLLYEHWNRQAAPQAIPERLASGLDTRVFESDARQKAIAREAGVKFVSLLDLLCDAKGCLTYRPDAPGKLFTWDYGHLTTDGSAFVAERMIDAGLLP